MKDASRALSCSQILFRVSEMSDFSPAHIRVNKFVPAAGQARVIVSINSPTGQQAAPICRARIVSRNSRRIQPAPVFVLQNC